MNGFLSILGYAVAAWLMIFWPLWAINKLRNIWKASHVRSN